MTGLILHKVWIVACSHVCDAELGIEKESDVKFCPDKSLLSCMIDAY